MADSVRDIIKERQVEVRDARLLQPERAAEILVELTSLLGRINDEIRTNDMKFNQVLLNYLDTEAKANRARIRAETSPEYDAKRQARDARELCLELIRSLKYFLKAEQFEH